MADRIGYEAVARALADSLAIRLRTTPEVDRWLAMLSEMAEGGDEIAGLEHELLLEAWGRQRADRQRRGVCVDCDYGRGHHDAACPRYHDATEATGRR